MTNVYMEAPRVVEIRGRECLETDRGQDAENKN